VVDTQGPSGCCIQIAEVEFLAATTTDSASSEWDLGMSVEDATQLAIDITFPFTPEIADAGVFESIDDPNVVTLESVAEVMYRFADGGFDEGDELPFDPNGIVLDILSGGQMSAARESGDFDGYVQSHPDFAQLLEDYNEHEDFASLGATPEQVAQIVSALEEGRGGTLSDDDRAKVNSLQSYLELEGLTKDGGLGLPGVYNDIVLNVLSGGRSSINGVEVLVPSGFDGLLNMREAAFTPNLAGYGPVTGKVVRVEPANGCGDLQNADQLQGNIALIDRGDCWFYEKVLGAQEAGALAVIVINRDDWPFVMGAPDDITANIPALMVSQGDGEYWP
jgi:hypothetical protein